MEKKSLGKKTLVGIVVSDRCDKTRTVEVRRTQKHPLYHKVVRTNKKFMAHDEENSSKVGDKVQIVEVVPYSKRKKWLVTKVIEEAK